MKAWDNRAHIAEALWNEYITNKPEVKAEAKRRLEICSANTCGYWDATGTSDKLVMRGAPGCTGCGCNGDLKVNCMSCYCYLGDRDTPGDGLNMDKALWTAMMTPEQEKELQETSYNKQQAL